MELLAGMLLLAVLMGGGLLWIQAARLLFFRRPILACEPRLPAPWGLADLLLGVGVWIGSQFAVLWVLRWGYDFPVEGEKTPEQMLTALLAAAISSAATFVVALAVIKLRTESTGRDLGFTLPDVGRDIATGVKAFMMLAPIVFGIQLVFVSFWKPSEHPLILMLEKSPDLRLFWAASLNAVLVAPVVEEFLFRGLLQGWLEGLRRGMNVEEVIFGATDASPPILAERAAEGSKPVEMNPYAPPVVVAEDAQLPPKVERPCAPWWPTFVSAALFSLAHYSHGPDFIALFVLAVGLGYLYRQTHRLLPSIVVHFLLNATSMLFLWIKLFEGG